MRSKRIIWVIVSLLVLFTASVSFGVFENNSLKNSLQQADATPTPETKDTRDLSKYGWVSYSETPADQSTDRFFANKRYDNQGWVYKTVNNPRTGGVGRITDDPPPPLFPIDESALIVVGQVTSVHTFLSNNKGSVYTEFTIRADDILKDKDSKPVNPNRVLADREGGIVVYPNGQRVLYQSSERGLPLIGDKYLFFLVRDDMSPNYRIITSYDLSADKVRQVEHGRPFDDFSDVSKISFIDAVRDRIARPDNE